MLSYIPTYRILLSTTSQKLAVPLSLQNGKRFAIFPFVQLLAFYRKFLRILPFNLLPSTYFFRTYSKQSLQPFPFLFRKEIC